MNRKNYRIVLFAMLLAGLALTLISAVVKDKTTVMILLILAATLYLSAAIQMVLYRNRPQLFDNKQPEQEE